MRTKRRARRARSEIIFYDLHVRHIEPVPYYGPPCGPFVSWPVPIDWKSKAELLEEQSKA
jgi:hypothetical protein